MSDVLSIILYYIIFILATAFFVKADSSDNDKRIRAYIFCGVMVLSIFASLRGMTVGWDTAATVEGRFERVRLFSSLGKMIAYRDHIKEPIYWAISYLIRIVTDDSRAFLFVMQLLTVGPIAVAAYENRKKLPVSIMMLTYMLLFYQMSFNIIRQSIAAAFLLLAYSKFMSRSYIKAGILAVFVCMFHNSGIIGIAFICFLYLLTNSKDLRFRVGLVAVSVLFGVLIMTSWQNIFRSLIEAGLLSDSYESYVSTMSGEVSNKFNTFRYRNIIIEMLRIIGTFIMVFVLKGRHTGTEKEIHILKYAGVLSLIIYSIIDIGFGSTLGHRATIYLDYLQIILYASYYPKALLKNKKVFNGRIILPKNGFQWSLLYCIGFHFMVYFMINFGHTIPYQLL